MRKMSLFFSVLFLICSCEPYFGWVSITNESGYDVWCDVLYPCPPEIFTYHFEFDARVYDIYIVPSGTNGRCKAIEMRSGMRDVLEGAFDTVSMGVFKVKDMEKYLSREVDSLNYIDYRVTLDDMVRNDWTIVYPPTEKQGIVTRQNTHYYNIYPDKGNECSTNNYYYGGNQRN